MLSHSFNGLKINCNIFYKSCMLFQQVIWLMSVTICSISRPESRSTSYRNYTSDSDVQQILYGLSIVVVHFSTLLVLKIHPVFVANC